MSNKDIFLVIGGSGFLGRHVVDALVARGDIVSTFDIVQRFHDVPHFTGDMSEQSQMEDALRKVSECHYDMHSHILQTTVPTRAARHV